MSILSDYWYTLYLLEDNTYRQANQYINDDLVEDNACWEVNQYTTDDLIEDSTCRQGSEYTNNDLVEDKSVNLQYINQTTGFNIVQSQTPHHILRM
jgi:hypothetical protein